MNRWRWTAVAWGAYKGAKSRLYSCKCPKCKEVRLRGYKQHGLCGKCEAKSQKEREARAKQRLREHEDFTDYYAHSQEVWDPHEQKYTPLLTVCPKCQAKPERHGLELRCCCGWIGYIRFNPPKYFQIPVPIGETAVKAQYESYWLVGGKGRRIHPRPSLDDYDRQP